MASFDYPMSRTTPGRRDKRSRMRAMLIQLECIVAASLCPIAQKRTGRMGLQLAKQQDQRLLWRHLHRDPSPPQHPGSSCYNWRANCVRSIRVQNCCRLRRGGLLRVHMYIIYFILLCNPVLYKNE